MPPATPQGEPRVVTAGDTWTWHAWFRDYQPSDGTGTWTLSYAIAGVGLLTWSGAWVTANGSGWDVTVPAASTGGLAAGRYKWFAILTGGSGYANQRVTVAEGSLTILANPTSLSAGDAQSWAEANLAVVESVLAGRITADIENYTIAGRSVTSIPISELYQLRNRFREEVIRERNQGRLAPAARIAFRQPEPSGAIDRMPLPVQADGNDL